MDGVYMVFNERRLISCREQSFNHKYIMGKAGKLSRGTTKILQPPHRR